MTSISTDSTANPALLLGALATFSEIAFASSDEAIEAYLALITRLLGTRSAFVVQMNTHCVKTQYTLNQDGGNISIGDVTPLEESFCQYIRATGAAVIVPDAARDVRVKDVASRIKNNIGAYIGVPLKYGNGITGTLCAINPSPRHFTQTHVDFLRLAAYRMRGFLGQEVADDHGLLPAPEAQGQIMLMRTIAHDLRTPLMSILGYTEMLQEEMLGAIEPDQQDALKRIRSSTQFIHRLVTDLVDATAAETGVLTLVTDTFSPAELARTTVRSCEVQAVERGLELVCVCDPQLSAMVGDADRLQQILLNLLSNALRYTAHGSVTLSVEQQGDTVTFAVADTGQGISQHNIEMIWHPHTRASGQETGLGLGLYVVQRLATAMGGSVGVESVVGEGSMFWLNLPLQGPAPRSHTWGIEVV